MSESKGVVTYWGVRIIGDRLHCSWPVFKTEAEAREEVNALNQYPQLSKLEVVRLEITPV